MQGIKMILVGFLLTIVGLGFLAILGIPSVSLVFFSTFPGLPPTPIGQDSGVLEAALNFERSVAIIAFLLILAGLVLAGIGMIRKN